MDNVEAIKKQNYHILFLFFLVGAISKIGNSVALKVFCYLIWLAILFIFFLKNSKVVRMDIFMFYAVLVPLFIFGIINNYEYIPVQSILAIFIYILPGYYIIRTIGSDEDVLIKAIFNASYINFVIYVTLCIMYSKVSYMNYAYGVLLNTCIILYKFTRNYRIYDLLLGIIGAICVIVFCSRGSAVVICALIVYLCINNIMHRRFKFPIVVGVFVALIYRYSNVVFQFLGEHGINSRNINKLMTMTFFESSGRDALKNKCIALIHNNSWGYGPLANRRLVYPEPYPHNLIYEIFIDYGIYIGTVLLILLVFLGIYLIKNQRYETARLGSIYFLIGAGILMLSNSLYYTNYFVIAAAMAFNIRDRVSQGHYEAV